MMLVTRNLPPLRGGMERLNQHIAIELAARFDVCVVGPEGCRSELPVELEVREVRVRPLWRFLLQAWMHAMRFASMSRPQLVLAGSGLTAPIAVFAAWLAGGRSVVYAHGLDLVTRHPLYRALWLPFLRRCDLCIVNSFNTGRLAEQVGVRRERITIIHPGVELPDPDDGGNGADFRRRYELNGRKLLLSVGRLTARKGLLEFVRNALPKIVAACPDAMLVVIGDEAPDALHRAGAGGASGIHECAHALGLDRHVLMLGARSDEELAAAYAAADVCVFPLRDLPGDVEGFGMVAVESAAHGLPAVAFNVGGVADAIADGRSGWLVPAGDYDGLTERILQVLETGRTSEVCAEARRFAETFEWQRFGIRLCETLQPYLARPQSSA